MGFFPEDKSKEYRVAESIYDEAQAILSKMEQTRSSEDYKTMISPVVNLAVLIAKQIEKDPTLDHKKIFAALKKVGEARDHESSSTFSP